MPKTHLHHDNDRCLCLPFPYCVACCRQSDLRVVDPRWCMVMWLLVGPLMKPPQFLCSTCPLLWPCFGHCAPWRLWHGFSSTVRWFAFYGSRFEDGRCLADYAMWRGLARWIQLVLPLDFGPPYPRPGIIVPIGPPKWPSNWWPDKNSFYLLIIYFISKFLFENK